MAGTAVWMDVLPSLGKFSAMLSSGSATAARTAGVKAGAEFSTGLAKGGQAGAQALVTELTAASRKAQTVIRQESAAISTARARELDATAAVQKAEAALSVAREKNGAESAAAAVAETKLAAATARQASATELAAVKLDSLKAAQKEGAVVTTQLAEAQKAQELAAAKATTTSARLAAVGTTTAGGLGRMAGAAKGVVGSFGPMIGLFGVLGAAEIGKKSIENAMDYQKSANVLVTAAGESVKNLAMIKSGLLQISGSTGTSLDQMTEGMYTVEKAGIRGAKGLAVMDAAAKGARDEGADLGTVTNALTSIMQSYGGSLQNPQKSMNALMVAAGHSKSTLQDFAGSLSNVLPVASKLGLSFAEVTGALGTMTSTGMSAQQASQDLNHVISALASPTRVMANEMGAYGISAAKVRDQLSKKGLGGTLEYLSDTVKSQLGPATAEAAKLIGTLPQVYQTYFQSLTNGTTTVAMFNSKIANAKDLTAKQKEEIMKAVPAARGYTQSMKNMTGGIVGLNVSMMLNGKAAGQMRDRTEEIGKATNSTADFQKKWNMTSATSAVQMAIAKQTISNVGTALASDLLPALASTGKALAEAVNFAVRFASANKSWLGPLALGLGAVFVAFQLAKGATLAYSVLLTGVRAITFAYIAITRGMVVAQRLATINQWSLNAAMDANPIGLVVIAITLVIAALVALAIGVMYAYNHWTWFRVAVDAVWASLKIGAAAVWGALKVAFAAIVVAVQAVAGAFTWFWRQVIVPVWNGIQTAIQFAWNAIQTVFSAIALAAKVIATPYLWLWHTIIVPVFQGIWAVVKWFYDAFVAITYLIDTAVRIVLGAVFTWFYTSIVKPVWTAVVGFIRLVVGQIITVFTSVNNFVRTVLGAVFSWFLNSVIKPVWSAITWFIRTEINGWMTIFRNIVNFVHSVLAPVFSWFYTSVIRPVWGFISSTISGVWKNNIKPVFDTIAKVIKTDLPKAFQIGRDAIGSIWKGLQNVVKEPIRFVVDTIINKALIGNFNNVARALEGKGAKLIPTISLPKGFAGGGVIPGYQSRKRDDVLMPMRRGEGVLVPEVVRALGPGFVHRLNAAGNRGGVSGVRSAAGFATGGVVGALSGAWNWTKDAVGTASSIVTDPAGTVGKLARGLLSRIPGSETVSALAAGMGSKVIDAAVNALKGLGGLVSGALTGSGGSAGGSAANPTGSGVTRWTADVMKALQANGLATSSDMVAKVLRQIQTESGGNPNAVQNGYTDVNTLSGDLAKGLMQTISATFNAYKFPGHGDIFNGYDNMLAALNYAKHRYGPNLNGLGEGHGYAEGGIVPTLLDQGGLLAPGVSVVANNTKKPEFALPEQRLQDIVANVGGGGDTHWHPTFNNTGDFDEREFMNATHKMSVMQGRRRR